MRSATAPYIALLLVGGRRRSSGLRSFLGEALALLARDRLFRVVALLALGDAGGIEETHHAIRRLRALGDPGLHLVHVEHQALGLFLRQQRIEVAETFD